MKCYIFYDIFTINCFRINQRNFITKSVLSSECWKLEKVDGSSKFEVCFQVNQEHSIVKVENICDETEGSTPFVIQNYENILTVHNLKTVLSVNLRTFSINNLMSFRPLNVRNKAEKTIWRRYNENIEINLWFR